MEEKINLLEEKIKKLFEIGELPDKFRYNCFATYSTLRGRIDPVYDTNKGMEWLKVGFEYIKLIKENKYTKEDRETAIKNILNIYKTEGEEKVNAFKKFCQETQKLLLYSPKEN